MADRNDKLPGQPPGPFYVDGQCIDCDLCRQSAGAMFDRNDVEGFSFVVRQPETDEEIAACREALDECPVEAIGDDGWTRGTPPSDLEPHPHPSEPTMKQVLKVARMGHPVLRQKAEPVAPSRIKSREFQDFIDSMYETMIEYAGVGLAAPQVHVSERVVVFHESAGLEDEKGEPILALINPEIEVLSDETSAMWEGCLSVPGLRGRVERPAHIRVRALDRHGKRIDLELEDFDAIVTQHECDHLDGILYIDRVKDTQQIAFEQEFERFWAEKAEEDGDFVDEQS